MITHDNTDFVYQDQTIKAKGINAIQNNYAIMIMNGKYQHY